MAVIERLSTSDLAMLVPDDVGWPQDIAALAFLEAPNLERVREVIQSRIHLVPRFRQVLIRPRRGLGVPFWTDATSFDISNHVQERPLSPGSGEPELLAAFEELRARRFDPRRPLWEVWLLPGLAGGRAGLVVKLHHTIADGVAGVATIAAFLDATAEAPAAAPPPWMPRPPPSAWKLLVDNFARRLAELARPLRALLHPIRTVRMIRRTGPLLREALREPRAPVTSLGRLVGARRRLVVVRSRLDLFKRIAHAHGAKVNDVLLAALAGALRALFSARGEPVDGLVLRVAVPISVHADRGAASGNRDSGMIVPLPIGEPDPARRLRAIAAETAARKRKPRPWFGALSFPGIVAVLRGFYRRMGRQRMINVYAANVPGPPAPVYLAGARLEEIIPVVPVTGNTPLAAGALSYAGQLGIGVVADPDACPDVERFAAALRRSIDDLAAAVTPPRPGPRACSYGPAG